MGDQELIERLKRNIEGWKELARIWETLIASRSDAKELAKRYRAKADQCAEVIKVLERG